MDPNQLPPQQPAQPVTSPPPQATAVPPVQPSQSPAMQPGMPAFMYPQANLPDQQPAAAHKSRTGLIIGIVLVLLVLVGGGVALFALNKKSTPDNSGNTQNNQTNDQANDQASESTSTATYKLSDSVKLTAAPSIIRGSLSDGWKVDTSNTGLDGIVHSNGCKVYFTQSTERSTGVGETDEAATDGVIQSMIEDLKKTGSVEGEQTSSVALRVDGSTDTIEFKQVTLTYSTSLTEHKVVTTVRNIDGYTVGTRFYCSTAAYSTSLSQQVLDGLTIKLPKAAN